MYFLWLFFFFCWSEEGSRCRASTSYRYTCCRNLQDTIWTAVLYAHTYVNILVQPLLLTMIYVIMVLWWEKKHEWKKKWDWTSKEESPLHHHQNIIDDIYSSSSCSLVSHSHYLHCSHHYLTSTQQNTHIYRKRLIYWLCNIIIVILHT